MHNSFARPEPVEVVIRDQTLRLAELETFTGEFGSTFGSPVIVRAEWTGPAADGGPEIAVAVIAGQLLRDVASDGYKALKRFIFQVYPRIAPRPATRYYLTGALSLSVRLGGSEATVNYRIPADLDSSQLSAALSAYEVLAIRQELFRAAAGAADMCWQPATGVWEPCPPAYNPQDDDGR